jgi:hypothetical protein
MAYLCFVDHHILPNEYEALPLQVKAFIWAAYWRQAQDQKKYREQAENKAAREG